MNRIILVYQPGTPQEEKYCIHCAQVPPPFPPAGPSTPGPLEIPQVERKYHPDHTNPQYKYLAFNRLAACDTPDDTDIIIQLSDKPENSGQICVPFNGGYNPGASLNIISIKLLDPGQLNP